MFNNFTLTAVVELGMDGGGLQGQDPGDLVPQDRPQGGEQPLRDRILTEGYVYKQDPVEIFLKLFNNTQSTGTKKNLLVVIEAAKSAN